MYKHNKRGAFREITEERGPRCNIDPEKIIDHYAPPLTQLADRPVDQEGVAEDSDDWPNLIREPFTAQEVWLRLGRCSNTAPGKDKIRYLHWKRYDPYCHILAGLFTRCASLMLVPSQWKSSRTILIHKDGDVEEPGNWRQISLVCTAGKPFAGCLARRLITLNEDHYLLAHSRRVSFQLSGAEFYAAVSHTGCAEVHARMCRHLAWPEKCTIDLGVVPPGQFSVFLLICKPIPAESIASRPFGWDQSDSLLAPWQKIDATKVLLTCLSFLLKSGFVLKTMLGELDTDVKKFARRT